MHDDDADALLGRQRGDFVRGIPADHAIGLQIATAWIEPFAEILRVTPLAGREWALVVTMAALPAVVGQVWKAWRAES